MREAAILVYETGATALVLALLLLGLLRLLRVAPGPARLAALALPALALLPPLQPFALMPVASLLVPIAPGVVLLALLVFARPLLPPLRPATRTETVAALMLALAFYAAALGATRFDPYAAGYDAAGAIGASGVVLAAGLLLGRPLLALLGPLGLAAWMAGWTGDNAADALMHPLLLLALVPGLLAPRAR